MIASMECMLHNILYIYIYNSPALIHRTGLIIYIGTSSDDQKLKATRTPDKMQIAIYDTAVKITPALK